MFLYTDSGHEKGLSKTFWRISHWKRPHLNIHKLLPIKKNNIKVYFEIYILFVGNKLEYLNRLTQAVEQ